MEKRRRKRKKEENNEKRKTFLVENINYYNRFLSRFSKSHAYSILVFSYAVYGQSSVLMDRKRRFKRSVTKDKLLGIQVENIQNQVSFQEQEQYN